MNLYAIFTQEASCLWYDENLFLKRKLFVWFKNPLDIWMLVTEILNSCSMLDTPRLKAIRVLRNANSYISRRFKFGKGTVIKAKRVQLHILKVWQSNSHVLKSVALQFIAQYANAFYHRDIS